MRDSDSRQKSVLNTPDSSCHYHVHYPLSAFLTAQHADATVEITEKELSEFMFVFVCVSVCVSGCVCLSQCVVLSVCAYVCVCL